jgi:hypothetical protein
LCSHQQCMRFPHSLQHLLLSVCDYTLPSGCEVVSHSGFDRHFPGRCVEHLCMYLLATHMYTHTHTHTHTCARTHTHTYVFGERCIQILCPFFKLLVYRIFCFCFLALLGFERRASCLLGRCSTTWEWRGLSLLSAGIIGMLHHTRAVFVLLAHKSSLFYIQVSYQICDLQIASQFVVCLSTFLGWDTGVWTWSLLALYHAPSPFSFSDFFE